jgi:superfamily II DNA or RNA helicase
VVLKPLGNIYGSMKIIVGNVYCTCAYTQDDMELDFDLDKRLRETLREKPNGFFHTGAYKSGWDGYTYFYTQVGKKFATGFLPLVLKYCSEWGVDVTILDNRKNLPLFKEERQNSFNGITFRDDQMHLINNVCNYVDGHYFPRGIFDAAPNAGKTVMVLGLYANLEAPLMLFLTRRFELFAQTVEFFEQYLGNGNVGVICSATPKHKDSRWKKPSYTVKAITIAMTPTLSRKTHLINVVKDLGKFNVLVVDECHYATAKNEKSLIMKIDAGMRLFVSGTPFAKTGDKVKKLQLIGMAGNVLGKISNAELIGSGVSRKVDVHVHLNHVQTSAPILSYKDEFKAVVQTSVIRCGVIYDEIVSAPTKQYLIVFGEIAHGKFIYDYLMSKLDYNIPTVFTHGTDKDRFSKVEMFLASQVNVLIVNDIIREGINMPNLDVLVNGFGEMSDIAIKQWVGRGLRTGSFNSTLKVIDFYDIGKYVKKHSEKRIEIYKTEGFNVIEHFDKRLAKRLTIRPKIK